MERITALARLRTGQREAGASPLQYLQRQGSGPALVCLHGLGDSSLTYPEFLGTEALRRAPAIAVDLPGFGGSPPDPAAGPALPGQARAVLSLLDALEVEAFVAVGHSMGGATAMHLARLAPRRCAGVILIEGNLGPPDCFMSTAATEAARAGRYAAWRDELVAGMEAANEPGGRRYLESFGLAHPESFLAAARALVEESEGWKLGRLYTALEVPTLFLHGGRSSPRATRAFVHDHGLPEILYGDSGHRVHWDAREDAARAGADFRRGLG